MGETQELEAQRGAAPFLSALYAKEGKRGRGELESLIENNIDILS